MKDARKAFTLIELLIVVAIIAILAAIAVPNFLEAQTRSKVSRTKADMRSIATAVEAYGVDYNRYPAAMDQHFQVGWSAANALSSPPFHSRTPSLLTTPIAYMTSLPRDTFRNNQSVLTGYLALFNERHTFFNFPMFEVSAPASFPNGNFGHATALAGKWLIYSPGPDSDEFNRPDGIGGTILSRRVYIDYDATNGTASVGNIFRTQANGELLGVDIYFYQ